MHWDQNIIFIIVAAIIGISRLVSRISENARKQDQRKPPPRARAQPTTQPVQRTPPKTDEQRVREFLEALGQPAGAAPPPKVQPRTQIPPRPVAPVQPPASMRPFAKPLFRTWREQAKEIVVLQQPTKIAPPEIKRIVVPPPIPAEANELGAWIEQEQAQTAAGTKMSIARTDDQPSVRASVDTVWKQALRSPNAARTAIILREIFGPPRGVQSSNFVFERI
jgi:hypothetical protein